MPFSGLFKLVRKALKFTISRPLQRFNIESRAKKYLGPDAKNFVHSPRAIGQLSALEGKLPQYPHLEAKGGYKSVRQRRLEAINKDEPSKALEATSLSLEQTSVPKSFSESEQEDELVRQASHQLEVMKTVTKVAASRLEPREASGVKMNLLESSNKDVIMGEKAEEKSARPLPKNSRLDMSDLTSIWKFDKPPPGRLNLDGLQEMLINKLADDKFWTPKEISNRYKIREDYAESLTKHLRQIRIIISPRIAKSLEIAGLNNPSYQAAKHIIYHVDKRLRTEFDKQHDKMFLPGEQLDEEVRNVIDDPKSLQISQKINDIDEIRRVARRPEPLKIAPVNKQTDRNQQVRVTRLASRSEPSISPALPEKKPAKPSRSSTE